jgi:hypothetical protein
MGVEEELKLKMAIVGALIILIIYGVGMYHDSKEPHRKTRSLVDVAGTRSNSHFTRSIFC